MDSFFVQIGRADHLHAYVGSSDACAERQTNGAVTNIAPEMGSEPRAQKKNRRLVKSKRSSINKWKITYY